MNIKLNYGQYVKREIVDAVNDGQYHDVILTTKQYIALLLQI